MVFAFALPDAALQASSTIPIRQKVTIAAMKVYGQGQAFPSKLTAKFGLV
jgi:hypothetical protein